MLLGPSSEFVLHVANSVSFVTVIVRISDQISSIKAVITN